VLIYHSLVRNLHFDQFTVNYFLVPVGFDERTLVDGELLNRSKSLETGELINAVQLNVSEGCNLKCTYCFAESFGLFFIILEHHV
jgi:sulfatase maturation enzyme AslB (radical SAM superfamily)